MSWYWDSREGGFATILHANNSKLSDRNEKLMIENEYLRSELEKLGRGDLIKKARKLGGDYHWVEFVDAVEKKIGLAQGWQIQIANRLGVSVAMIEKWRIGFEEIPEEIFEQIKDLKKSELVQVQNIQTYTLKEEPSEPTKKVVQNDKFPWAQNPEIELETCRRFINGDGITAVEAYMREQIPHVPFKSGGASAQRVYNTAPPQSLISSARSEGPTDWAELWLIGITLAKLNGKKGWFGPIMERIRTADYAKPSIGDDLSFLSQAWIDNLRAEYKRAEIEMNARIQKKGSELPEWANKLASVIHSYGEEGIPREALAEADSNFNKSALDLVRYNTVFSVFRNGSEYFIHSDFKKED